MRVFWVLLVAPFCHCALRGSLVYRAPLQTSDPIYTSILSAFKKSTLMHGVQVTRVFALRSAFSLSRITNLEKKLRLESGETFHNIEVKDWSQPPFPCAQPSSSSAAPSSSGSASSHGEVAKDADSQRHALFRRLVGMKPPAFKPMDSVTGVVQVFHGCFNEHGAMTIVSACSVLEVCDRRTDERTSVRGSCNSLTRVF